MTFDVAVVGAGPAGSSAAMSLAQRGFSVALMDRAVFPRDKACGEFINPAGCDYVEQIFGVCFSDLLAAGGAPVSHVRLQLARRPALQVQICDENWLRTGVSIPREILDALLVEKCRAAGVTVMAGCNVRELERGVDRVYLRGDATQDSESFLVAAKLIIAADGTHSHLARSERLVRPIRGLSSIGVVAHFDGIASSLEEPCVWMFPSDGDGLMFGFTRQANGGATLSGIAPISFARGISADADGFLRQWIARYPSLHDMTKEAKITRVLTAPCFGHSLKRCFADRMLFVGDAATFIDPFTGEGIHHALESSAHAASVVKDAFELGNFSQSFLSRYGALRRELMARYRLCGVVHEICSRPWLVNLLGSRLSTRPLQAQQLIGALTDVLPPSKVVRAGWVLGCILPGRVPRSINRDKKLVRKAEQRPN